MGYSKDELLLLDKDVLANIILEQERRINTSRRGQPKRDNLVGQTFGALTVVGDAGNQQAHSTWHCRCSGNIGDPELQGICDNKVRLWGSNLKADRHQYCGNESCPAARQVLALKRQKELPQAIVANSSKFMDFLQEKLVNKFALMGSAAATLRDREQAALLKLLNYYYGLIVSGQASKLEEIGKMLGRNDLHQLKRNLDEYVKEYRLQLEGKS
jgi:hypothetical protein